MCRIRDTHTGFTHKAWLKSKPLSLLFVILLLIPIFSRVGEKKIKEKEKPDPKVGTEKQNKTGLFPQAAQSSASIF